MPRKKKRHTIRKRTSEGYRIRRIHKSREMEKGGAHEIPSGLFSFKESFYRKGYEWGVALALDVPIEPIYEQTPEKDLPFLTTEDQLDKLFVQLSTREGFLELIEKTDPDFIEAKIGFIDGFRLTFDTRLREYIKKLKDD